MLHMSLKNNQYYYSYLVVITIPIKKLMNIAKTQKKIIKKLKQLDCILDDSEKKDTILIH